MSNNSRQSYRRQSGKRKIASERVLIVTEGKKTEPSYFHCLVLELNLTSVLIKRSKGTSPLNVVESAISLVANTDDIRTAYCVFDQDGNYANYKEALEQVKQKNRQINGTRYLAVPSIPCFEFWYMLHVQYTRKSYKGSSSPCKDLIESLKQNVLFSGYNKATCEGFFDQIASMRGTAISNAKQIISEGKNDDFTEFHEDPSTRVHLVVEDLIKTSEGMK